MRVLNRTSLLLIFALASATVALASDFKVIANPSVEGSSISMDDLRNVFLATKTTLGGSGRVEPVLLKSGPAHEAFLKRYLSKSDAALGNYYRSLVFTGKGTIPRVCNSDAEMAAYIAKTKGAIGYVSAAATPAGVKLLTVN